MNARPPQPPTIDAALHQLQLHIILKIHAYMQEQGLVHITTPHLQQHPPYEYHIHPFMTHYESHEGHKQPRYLHASPEIAMKTYLAQEGRSCYQIARVYRNRDNSPLHKSEFMMLEWYRIDGTSQAMMDDCQQILLLALAEAQRTCFSHKEAVCAAKPYKKRSMQDIFRDYCGIDLASCLHKQAPYGDTSAIKEQARMIGVHCSDGDSWTDVFDRLFVAHIDGELGRKTPLFVTDYPRPLSFMAQPSSDDSRFCQRMELFVCGVEIANGYLECQDVDANRQAFIDNHAQPNEAFLAMLQKHPLPSCYGMALGLDRLVMLASGAPTIQHVP
ncbi:MAG: hypothetical protein GDA50_01385 [Alphaproteobacteria bacterium GM202ARS2]|nr:hypothetical protein [Alphaproteobacteria bacterium GM202ARS2]